MVNYIDARTSELLHQVEQEYVQNVKESFAFDLSHRGTEDVIEEWYVKEKLFVVKDSHVVCNLYITRTGGRFERDKIGYDKVDSW